VARPRYSASVAKAWRRRTVLDFVYVSWVSNRTVGQSVGRDDCGMIGPKHTVQAHMYGAHAVHQGPMAETSGDSGPCVRALFAFGSSVRTSRCTVVSTDWFAV
jgi:hypothetical protein